MNQGIDERRAEAQASEQRPSARRRPTLALLASLPVVGLLILLVAGLGVSGGFGRTLARPAPPSASAAAPRPTVTAAIMARDSGAREFATGPATPLAPGRFRYVVEKGDTFFGIASRFHVCTYDLVNGRPVADQSALLAAGTPITVQLGTWPTNADGSVDCVWDD